jgi:Ca-activated chloride channel homolog
MLFTSPFTLYLLLAIPLLILFYLIIFDQKRKARELFASPSLFARLAPEMSLRKQKVKALLTVVGVLFLLVALAGPRWGEKERDIQAKGVDVFIALDVSQSMLADDYKPDRLTLAKSLLKKIVDNLQGNRIGVIAFAGAAYIECPLTIDVSAVKMYIDDLNHTSVPIQGTNIGDAIKLAIDSFPKGDKKSRVLVLLTDGEDLAGKVKQYVDMAARENVRIYTLGVGSPEGVPLSMKDEHNRKTGPKTTREGKVVNSRLDEKTLKEIAQVTKGKYLHCTYDEKSVNDISNDILHLEKRLYESRLQKHYVERFQLPLSLALLLLIGEPLISEKREKKNG